VRSGIKKLCFLAILSAGAAVISGCERSQQDQLEAIPPTLYRHAMDGAPSNLDPARASNIYANFLVVNLYDTLFRYKYLARPYELEPNLAEGMPDISSDGLTYTIRIKRDVRFIDDESFPGGKGRRVTAGDFVYSIKRQFDPETRAQGAWLWQGKIVGLDEWGRNGSDYDSEIPGLRALDDHTIQIQLVEPFPQLTHTFTQGYSALVPQEAVAHYGSGLATHPVGSGPYRLERFDSAGAVLLRNDDFRQEPFSLAAEGYDPSRQKRYGLESLEGRVPPFTDRIEVEFVAEEASRWNAFISGELDFIKVPVTQFDHVLAGKSPPELNESFSKRYHFDASLESGFVRTDFNMDDQRIGHHPDPGQDERNRALRCAIVKAFDWKRRNEIFYYGIGQVFPGIIPPGAPEYDAGQDRSAVGRDLEGARRLLAEHGWTPETLPDLEYGFPSNVTERQMFEQFRSFMADIAYPQEKIRPLTYATYGDYARAYINRQVMLITSSWTMDYPDAQNTVQLFYGPNASPGANSANYDNPEFNQKYRASAAMQPSPARTEMYRRMSEQVTADCATISGISRTLVLLWSIDAVMLPDRSFVGGFFFRFVDTQVPKAN
jgi:ABC-type transport system substrate-binding protein